MVELTDMARTIAEPNRAGFGGRAGAVARKARPALQERLVTALGEPGAIAAEDRLLAAQVLLDPKRSPSPEQKEMAAKALAELVADERVPHGIAIRAGKLLDDLSRWTRKRGGA